MKRKIYVYVVGDHMDSLSFLTDFLGEGGWQIDPELKVIRLDNAIVYHLIKYTEKELAELEVSEQQPEIVSVKSVPIDQADTWIQQQGYQVEHLYAKSVTLVKRE